MPRLLARRLSCAALLGMMVVAATPADEPAPLHKRIDQLISSTRDYSKNAAPLASDAEFLRRITLDLNGTIPTAADVRAFLADKDDAKRAKLIDKLLASPDFARHMARTFDVILMERRADVRVPKTAWQDFLRESFEKNKPYDQLVRDLLSSDGADPKTRPQAKFLLDRAMDAYQVTRDVSKLFLGRNITCAQCHDHPNVVDYLQTDFHGIYAYFNRTFLFPDDKNAAATLAEKGEGEVTFMSVFDKAKKTKETGPRLPGGKAVMEPKLEKGKEYTVAPAKGVKPVPVFSRRAQLAGMLTSAENKAFSRTAVNRFWALMMGRGLVHPLDWDHDGNLPSHPELLDELTDEFIAHKFDVKWLLREFALSQTYQRSSELPKHVKEPNPERYWVANLKPLTPEQLAFAVLQATGRTDAERRALGKNLTEPALHARLLPQATAFIGTFGRANTSPDEFQATLDQTLFLKNGAALRGLLAAANGNLTERLNGLTDTNAFSDELFLSVLSRLPTDEERKDIAEALKDTTNRPAVLAELGWALITSAEFRFNH